MPVVKTKNYKKVSKSSTKKDFIIVLNSQRVQHVVN